MPFGSGTVSLPLVPSTSSSSPMVIFTPFGNGMGLFPTLDICVTSLPELAKDLTAKAFFPRRTAGHDAARGRQNIDAQSTQHFGNFPAAHVDPASGPRHAFNARNYRHVAGRIFQVNANASLGDFLGQLEVHDEALFLQNAGDLHLQLRGGHVHLGMMRHLSIADARQHVGDWIGCGHNLSPVILRLPASLDHAGNLTGESKLPDTDPAQVELPDIAALPPASETPVAKPDCHRRRAVLGQHLDLGLLFFRDLGCSCHVPLFLESYCCLNGIPICFNSASPSASVFAVVTIEIFIPLTFSILL